MTTFLTAIFLTILAMLGALAFYPPAEGDVFSNSKIDSQIKGTNEISSGDRRYLATPKIITIQGFTPISSTGGDRIPPKIVNFLPTADATNVQLLLPIISVTFSEPVRGSTITTSTFQVRDSAGKNVPGIIKTSPTIATFTPVSTLAGSKVYTVTVNAGVKDLAGNALVGVTKWSFTTAAIITGGGKPLGKDTGGGMDAIPPRVVSSIPADGAKDIPTLLPIAVTFSEPIRASTLTTSTLQSTFQVRDSANNIVPGKVTMSDPFNAVFLPSLELASSSQYTIIFMQWSTASNAPYKGVQDMAGNNLLIPPPFSFTTADVTPAGAARPNSDIAPPKVVSISPKNGVTGVRNFSPITVTFSEPILGIDKNTFNVVSPASYPYNRIQGNIIVSHDKIAAFKPSMAYGYPDPKWYIIVISPEIRDLNGNPMTAPVISSFQGGGR